MTTPETFTEDELLAYLRDAASSDLHARIEAAVATQPTLRAEIALMRGLKDTLANEDVQPFPKDFGWQKLKADIGRDDKPTAARAPLWRAAAACLGILAIGQAAYIVATASSQSGDLIETATAGSSAAGVLVIGFTTDASASDIIALLEAVNGNIIGGPNSIGMFRVAFDSEDDATNAQTTFETSTLIDLVASE